MSLLYFLHIGLPGALKPDERDHRNSGFSIPACCSKGLCILPLSGGKRALILSRKSGKFRLPPNIAHRCLLMCLSADDELVLVRMIHAWPVRVIQDHPGCMRGKGQILCCSAPHWCFAFPYHSTRLLMEISWKQSPSWQRTLLQSQCRSQLLQSRLPGKGAWWANSSHRVSSTSAHPYSFLCLCELRGEVSILPASASSTSLQLLFWCIFC